MTTTEEPTDDQLADFLVIYAKQIPGFQNLNLSPTAIKFWLHDPECRKIGLAHHKQFQQNIDKHYAQMMAGELQCAHIRTNGRNCPNRNTPGSYYCGLHPDETI